MHRVEISVIGRGAVTVQGRSMATFMVSVEPDNDAYRILHHVTVDRPHEIIYWTDLKRERFLLSEVRTGAKRDLHLRLGRRL
jgi:hypothetical protein